MTRQLLRLAGRPGFRCFAWLIACAIAVMGWLAVAMPAFAAMPSATTCNAYAYDAPLDDAPDDDAATERGPPVGSSPVSTYDLDGLLPLGELARADAATPSVRYTYDDPAQFVQTARSSHALEEPLGSAEAVPVVVRRCDVAANTATDGVSLSLKYKPGWSAAQRSAADSKVAALNDVAQAGGLQVTAIQRSGTSAASRYRSSGGTIPRGADDDHTIVLQLGGLDDIANMSPLDLSVTRSLGSQIMWQLRGVQPGTCVIAVSIC